MSIVFVVTLGLTLGIFAAIAPLGPVTLLVLRRALQRDVRGAMHVGVGRIPAEVVYVAFASFGMAAVLDRFPHARTYLEVIGAIVLIIVGGAFAWMRHELDPDAAPPSRRGAFATGFLVSALNPTLIVSWSAIVAIAMSLTGFRPEAAHKLVFPLSVGGGIALGYAVLVWSVRRWGEKLEQRAITIVLRSLGILLIALGAYNALRLAMGQG